MDIFNIFQALPLLLDHVRHGRHGRRGRGQGEEGRVDIENNITLEPEA